MMFEKTTQTTAFLYAEFKQQLIDLYHSGKRKCNIVREYDIAKSLLDKWISQANNSGSFKKKDNRRGYR